MALSGISLNAASVVGAGQAIMPDKPVKALNVSMSLIVGGSSDTTVTILLEGTIDGANWYTIGSYTNGYDPTVEIATVSNGGNSGAASDVFAGFRANITAISGTSPAVSAAIAIMPN